MLDYRSMMTKIIIPRGLSHDICESLKSLGIDKEYVYGPVNVKEEISSSIKKIAEEQFNREFPIIQKDVKDRTKRIWG